jgi:RNA polymerase sigma-70 factor (ECF subfamily)
MMGVHDLMKRNPRQDDLYNETATAYSRALERLVKAYEAHPDKQRDLLQDIHLALWQSFDSFEGKCSLRTWVYRVAHNTAATHVMKERQRNSAQWITLDEIEAMPHPAHGENTADRQLALQHLLELIRRMRPSDRQVMLLYLEGLDAESIGEIVGATAGHVRVQIHRIKALLAQRFHGGSKHAVHE